MLKTLPRHLQPCHPPRLQQQEQLPWFQRHRLRPLQPHRLMVRHPQPPRPVQGEVLDLPEADWDVETAASAAAVALEVLAAR